MASFVGTTVRLTLRSGDSYVGTILSIDPATATLKVQRTDNGEMIAVRREELQDVSTVTETSQSSSAPSNSVSTPKQSHKALADPMARSASPADSRKKRNRRKGERADAGNTTTAPAGPASMFDEEFDFTKSTQNFDKKKIWEEIRNQEANPNPHLLVNINRNPLLQQSAGSKQPMLAPTEMVLDEPSEPIAAPTSNLGEVQVLRSEVDTLSGALAEARSEIQRLRSQVALSEALTGLHIEDLGDGTYVCGVYKDAKTSAAHWRHKHQQSEPVGTDGALRYLVRAPGIGNTDAVSLGYGGPHRDHSDAEVLEKLPDHFQSDINIKLDNAPLFQRRLTDLMQGL